jgi:hypothetical protein
MTQIQESLEDDRAEAADVPTIICNDCKASLPVASLIPVDALHVQCPLCLYIFFKDASSRNRV